MTTNNQIISQIKELIKTSNIDFHKPVKDLENEYLNRFNVLCERILNDNSSK